MEPPPDDKNEADPVSKRVLKDMGHIHFGHPDTILGVPVEQGINEDGTPASPSEWIALYMRAYGGEETITEATQEMLGYAEQVFGPNPKRGDPQPELFRGLQEELGIKESEVSPAPVQTSEIVDTNDPLYGTEDATKDDPELGHGWGILTRGGAWVHPGIDSRDPEYRQAYKDAKEDGWL